LHKSGQLGGVIIDVRNNGGGSVGDYPYVMGALLPSGGFEIGKARFKHGTGRLDYSPLMPQVVNTMEAEHAIITEPIVVLANCHSVSMAEITSISTKYIDNATLIGKRTWGGICALSGNDNFSINYTGHIGEEDKTPVYVYLPMLAQFDREGHILEGVGVTPDIEIDLDIKQFKATGKDSQLDCALQHIRNRK
jgi:C-terminal processing protease CtpA/Prc